MHLISLLFPVNNHPLFQLVCEDIDIEALLASEINVQLGGHPGRRYRYSQGDGTIDIRLYLVDERAYLLLAVDNNETNVDRFISSFALR